MTRCRPSILTRVIAIVDLPNGEHLYCERLTNHASKQNFGFSTWIASAVIWLMNSLFYWSYMGPNDQILSIRQLWSHIASCLCMWLLLSVPKRIFLFWEGGGGAWMPGVVLFLRSEGRQLLWTQLGVRGERQRRRLRVHLGPPLRGHRAVALWWHQRRRQRPRTPPQPAPSCHFWLWL